MKYIYCVIIYDIIGNFDEIASGVIADDQPFIYISFQQLLMEWMPQGIMDIFFCYTMLKCSLIKLDYWEHGPSLLFSWFFHNTTDWKVLPIGLHLTPDHVQY